MNHQNKQSSKHPRVYKHITPRTVALHEAQAIISGNNTQAVRVMESEYLAPHARAHRIVKKSKDVSITEYIESSLQQIGEQAVERLEQLVNSEDEQVAGRAVTYTIDHLRGKAISRNINVSGTMNIQSVLDD